MNGIGANRGKPSDFDEWVDHGAAGWGWDDVLPYFRLSEHNERIRNDLHGQGGPLWVSDLRSDNPIHASYLEAARQTQPDLPRALLQDEWADDSIKTAVRLGCLALVVNHTHLNAERIAAIHDAGLKALSYTVNQASRASMLWRAGLDGLITDRVDVFEPQARLGANPARLMVEAVAWMA